MALIAFTALIPIFVFTSIVYVVLGERALRLFRSRYPVEWTKRDEPSFVVLVPSWRRYYSPAAASNFFTFRDYRALNDAGLARQCDVVRLWQVTSYAALGMLLLVGYFAL